MRVDSIDFSRHLPQNPSPPEPKKARLSTSTHESRSAFIENVLNDRFYFCPTQIAGDLNLSGCLELQSLPKNLHVGGSLFLIDCARLDKLPEGLSVGGDLDLEGCTCLKELPENLHVGGELYLNGCTHLKKLPKNLYVGESLDLERCTHLVELTESFHVGNSLYLGGCINLRVLPANLHVKGEAYLGGCVSLTKLPKNLHVEKNLDLEGCTRLIELPEDLHVKGDLHLEDCRNLTCLPEKLNLGGNLSLKGCVSVGFLPDWVTTLGRRSDGKIREVHLENTGLSDAIIERLRGAEAPGIRFHFSCQAQLVETTFSNWQEALSFWKKIAESDLDVSKLSLGRDRHEAMVKQFLERLINTAEYHNQNTRKALACRILEVFKVMTQDETLKERSVDLIMQGIETCDDRVIATVNGLEVLHKVYEAEKGGTAEELRQLAFSLLKLEKVKEAARNHAGTLTWVDEVEIELVFQVGLRETLELPVSTQNMIFRNLAQISDHELQEIGERIRQTCTEEALESYLQTWEPWRKHLRRESVPAYETLNTERWIGPQECVLTGEEAKRPVWVSHREGGVVCDYQALIKAYIETGKNPFSGQELDWMQVRGVAPNLKRKLEGETPPSKKNT